MTDLTRPLAAVMAALHPGWDLPGCAAEIHKARHLAPPDELAHAVIAYAMRADVRTPALLAADGPHWHTGRTPNARVTPTRCDIAGHEYERLPCRSCRAEEIGGTGPSDPPAWSDTQAATNHAGLALARAALTKEMER